MTEDVKTRWNALAKKFNIPRINGDVHVAMMTSLLARISKHPNYWELLEEGLAKRSEFYVSKRQPTFKQAVSSEYFADKIRDGGWDDPKFYETPTGGVNKGARTSPEVLDRLAAAFEKEHGISTDDMSEPELKSKLKDLTKQYDDLPF